MIDLNKKYKTIDGRDVKLYAIEGDRVMGAIEHRDGLWRSDDWAVTDGNYYEDGTSSGDTDLVEVKRVRTKTFYLNIYEDDCFGYSSEYEARHSRTKGVLATKEVTIEFEEGEGL
jgi:hypothetical protein